MNIGPIEYNNRYYSEKIKDKKEGESRNEKLETEDRMKVFYSSRKAIYGKRVSHLPSS
jgi:hypothetical protein